MAYKWVLSAIAVLAPMLFWALLALAAQRRPRLLVTLLPGLKAFSWSLWIVAPILAYLTLTFSRRYALAWVLVATFYLSLNTVRGWTERKVNPEAAKVSSGWWPTPKDY